MKLSTLIRFRSFADHVRSDTGPVVGLHFYHISRTSQSLVGVTTLSWRIICRLVFVSFCLFHHVWFGCFNNFAQYTFFLDTLYMLWDKNVLLVNSQFWRIFVLRHLCLCSYATRAYCPGLQLRHSCLLPRIASVDELLQNKEEPSPRWSIDRYDILPI